MSSPPSLDILHFVTIINFLVTYKILVFEELCVEHVSTDLLAQSIVFWPSFKRASLARKLLVSRLILNRTVNVRLNLTLVSSNVELLVYDLILVQGLPNCLYLTL